MNPERIGIPQAARLPLHLSMPKFLDADTTLSSFVRSFIHFIGPEPRTPFRLATDLGYLHPCYCYCYQFFCVSSCRDIRHFPLPSFLHIVIDRLAYIAMLSDLFSHFLSLQGPSLLIFSHFLPLSLNSHFMF